MTGSIRSWISDKKWILAGVGVPILVVAWWAFRPREAMGQCEG